MSYIYRTLKPEYVRDLSIARINSWREEECNRRAEIILKLKKRYKRISNATGVPIVWIMAINERESGSKMRTYLGNGQALNRRTTQEPRGRGPFHSWEEGALDALRLHKLDQVDEWDWPRMMYQAEKYNGFGPRMHHRRTGYIWAGTNIYTGGKYVVDHRWDARAHDLQLGCWPIMRTLVTLDPSLDLPSRPQTSIQPEPPLPPPPPEQHPDLEVKDMLWVQHALNAVQDARLYPDGSWGRNTSNAVAAFQLGHNLVVDGIPGEDTKAALTAAMAEQHDGANLNA